MSIETSPCKVFKDCGFQDKTVTMKKILFPIIAILFVQILSAQETKRLENNILLGSGVFLESGPRAEEYSPGLVFRLSYGLDIRLNERWSVMPGAGLRGQGGPVRHIGRQYDGGNDDSMSLADFFIFGWFHVLKSEASPAAIGIAPVFSYMIDPDEYYIDADPDHPLSGRDKFNRMDIGIRPSIRFFTGKHFQWGLEGQIGLMNALRQYPEYNRTDTSRLHYVAVTCGWHF